MECNVPTADMPKTILLVDDEALLAMTTASVLKRNGFAVLTVYNGEKAITAVEEEKIDCILMDIDLGKGKMDGTEAASLILQNHDIPVVFLSSHTEPEIVEKTEKITSYGYVVKNSGETVLLASIKMAFRLHEANAAQIEKSKQLEASEKMFSKAFHSGPLLMTISSIEDGMYLEVNENWIKKTGYSRQDAIGKKSHELGFISPEEREQLKQCLLASGKVEGMELRLTKKSGETMYCIYFGEIIELDGKKRLLSIAEDISERKAAEEAVRESERQKNIILNSSAEMIAFYGTDLRVIWANRASAESVGETAEALVGRHCYEIWHQRSEPCEGCPVLGALETGEASEAEQKTPDGRYWSVRGYPVKDGQGNVTALVEFGQEVTEQRKLAEKFQAIADYTYDWEDWIGVDGKLLWVNPAVQRISGYTPEECYAMPDYPYPLIHPEDQAVTEEDIREGITKEASYQNKHIRIICKDGREKWIVVCWQPIYNFLGEFTGVR